MVQIDIMALANDFILEVDQPVGVRLEIAKAFLDAVVEYINTKDKEKRLDIFDAIYAFGDEQFHMIAPDKVFDSYLTMVKQKLRSANWDKRLVIKLNMNEFGKGYFTATLAMDLEATAAKLGWDTNPAEPEKESVMDSITDTPSMDQINEFNRLNDNGDVPEPPLSPNRRAEFVREVKRVCLQTHRR